MSSQNDDPPAPAGAGEGAEKEWKLRDCKMEVVGIGKKDPVKDEFITIDLEFTFDELPRPRSVGELTLNGLHSDHPYYIF